MDRRAIRMNILCNPTGKKHHFRAIDWLVEHNNLYIKVRTFRSSVSSVIVVGDTYRPLT